MNFKCATLIILLLQLFSNLAFAAPSHKIGLLLTLSGVSAEVGEACQQGVDLARSFQSVSKFEKDQKLRFITEDCRSEPRVAVDSFRKLVGLDKVSAIITLRAPIGMTLNPLSLAQKIPILGAVGHPQFASQNAYAFQTWPHADSEGGELARYLIARNFKTLSVLSVEDDWTVTLSKAVIDEFKRLGGQVVFQETVLPNEVDFTTIMSRITQKKASAVLFNFTLAQGGYVLKKAHELKVPGEFFTNYWGGFKSFQESAGKEAIEGVRFPEMSLDYPLMQQQFKRIYGESEAISAMTLACYSATFAVVQALEKCNPVNEPARPVAECLLTAATVTLPDGIIAVKDRIEQFNIVIKQVSEGKVKRAP